MGKGIGDHMGDGTGNGAGGGNKGNCNGAGYGNGRCGGNGNGADRAALGSADWHGHDWGRFARERGEALRPYTQFTAGDRRLQRIFESAAQKLRGNLRDFGGRTVLVEGGGYDKIWLETQPMGGEMYARFNMEAALNNQLLFMEHQRADGRMPGSIRLGATGAGGTGGTGGTPGAGGGADADPQRAPGGQEAGQGAGRGAGRGSGSVFPEFNKFQGFCFPWPALNMYYISGAGEGYLRLLQSALARFDAYLWAWRDSDGDGCLESWCVTDTGEDGALRYGDAPFWHEGESPPQGYASVPMASMDIMCFSFSARDALARISALLGDGQAALWAKKAAGVRGKIAAFLWDPERGACFDRSPSGRAMPTLVHNNLRCMYWGAFSQPMADRFVAEHLTNPGEFWTPMPLPSVAASDPLFRNNPGNDWSGQPQGLTYQRAIRALENYGFHGLIPALAEKLFSAIGDRLLFTQQYDTFTGSPSGGKDGYGPTMLAALEYIARLHGVSAQGGELAWGAYGGTSCEYALRVGERSYVSACDGKRTRGYVDGRRVFEAGAGSRVVTGPMGEAPRVMPYAARQL